MKKTSLFFSLLFIFIPHLVFAGQAGTAAMPWWGWTIILFFTTFFIGLFGVLAGIGGGVLFVPIVSGFFPFHIDFVRGAGLFIALGSSLAAAPTLLRKNLSSLKLALPSALVASAFSIVGALLGLWLSSMNPAYIQGSLGVLILAIVSLMVFTKSTIFPDVNSNNSWSQALELNGVYFEESSSEEINWNIHRTKRGLLLFVIVGILAGVFGLGAGWANVPILNMVLGAPLKVAVATSSFSLSITDTTAAWIYLNKGAVLPIMVAPSIIGIMLGARFGAKLLPRVKPTLIRKMVIAVLFFAGVRSLAKAFGY